MSESSQTPFQSRLRQLIGNHQTVSAFARHVGISESLLRKYLTGTEPSLGKAWQIAQRAQVSLDWLAGGGESA